MGRQRALNCDGVAAKGAHVMMNDILVNKYTPLPNGEIRPAQLLYKYPQPAIIDHVFITPPG